MKYLSFLSFLLAFLLFNKAAVSANIKPDDLGTIRKESDILAIAIHLDAAPSIKPILTKAFSTHGAFVLTDEKAAQLRYQFEIVGDQRVELKIFSGSPMREQFSEVISGSTLREAALKAGDRAVIKTIATPGYFSGLLTFVSGSPGLSEIFVSDLFFTNPQQITRDRSRSLSPHWSPDGGNLFYTSYYKSGFPDIFKIRINSGKREPFVSFKGINTGAIVSPTGWQIAMILSGTGNVELHVSDHTGRNVRRLTSTRGLESDPCWSPDGKKILFSSTQGGGAQLYTINASGGKMVPLQTQVSGQCTEPAWNHYQPHLIAFTALIGKEFEIALYDTKEGKSRIITSGEGDAIEPTWTRDGRHLIYTRRTPEMRQLHLIDTLTGKVSMLPHDRMGQAWQADYFYPQS